MKMSLAAVKQAEIPLKPVSASAVVFPGMSAEINIPSIVLRNYDVLINFPDRELTIARSGILKFQGVSSKVAVNSENGLVQIPSVIEGKKYNLGLDVGASVSFLAEEVFTRLASAHPGFPKMTGGIGPANMWGLDEEPAWKLMRIERLQYGPLFLTNIAVADFLNGPMGFFERRAGIRTAGLLGSNALLNYRIGIDYAHSTVYFDLGSTFKAPDFDVVGLTLGPEDDGRFTILGVADYLGSPSVSEAQAGDHLVAVDGIPVPDSTMGQVRSMLEGMPDQERKLTLERGGKQLTVVAHVRHFLGETPENNSKGSSPK